MDEAELIQRCDELLQAHDPASTAPTAFLGHQFDAGLAYPNHRVGDGGLGLSPRLARLAGEHLLTAGAPRPAPETIIGQGMGAPTVATHGTEEQRARWLRPLFAGEEIWCQLFSEPGAGSDLAALATRARRDGDEWVISGQKMWTTVAHLSRWGMLLARTDPGVAKHKGLTYFVVDMHAPGVTVRPLRQITGESEFCEVFFDDARIPDAHRLGEVGHGWTVAITTLMNERVSIGGGTPERGSGLIGHALSLWREHGADAPELQPRMTQLWIDAELLRLTNVRATQIARTGPPGPEGSVGKMVTAELQQRILEFCLDLKGTQSLLYCSYDAPTPPALDEPDGTSRHFLRLRASTIAGGTSEVMRTLIGERVLGLPPEPRVDKDLPWSEVRRS